MFLLSYIIFAQLHSFIFLSFTHMIACPKVCSLNFSSFKYISSILLKGYVLVHGWFYHRFLVSLYSLQPKCLASLIIITPIDSVGIIPVQRVLSRIWFFGTPWAHQVSLSLGFSRQEYCSESPFPYRGDLPNSGIEPMSPASPALAADSLPEPLGKPQRGSLHMSFLN